MKRTLLLLGTMCLSAYAQAQQYWLIESKNAIKWNVPALTTHTLSLQYERTLGEKTSVALGLNLMPSGSVPLAQTIRDYYLSEASDKNSDAANDFAQNATLSGWAVTPEFRFYLGKKPQQGFYLAPFVRFAQYTFKWSYTFMDQDIPRPSDINGKLAVAGGGLMIGHQWKMNNFLLDWWILGLSYNTNTISVHTKTDLSDLDQNAKKELVGYVEDVTVNDRHMKATINNQGVTGQGGILMPGIRAGLCIGYKF